MATTTSAALVGPSTFRMLRTTKASLDHLIMQPFDVATTTSTFRSTSLSLLGFFIPVAAMQELLHKRYEVETVAEDADHVPYGMATVIASVIHPLTPVRSRFERWLDPP